MSAHSLPAQAVTPSLDAADYERLADFRHALRQFLAFSERAARGVGLTPQQHQALLAIKGAERRGGMSVGDLSRRLLLRHHSAVELANRLVDSGWAVREASFDDGRKVMLALTPAGQEVLSGLSAAHLAELQRIGPGLSGLIDTFSGGR